MNRVSTPVLFESPLPGGVGSFDSSIVWLLA